MHGQTRLRAPRLKESCRAKIGFPPSRLPDDLESLPYPAKLAAIKQKADAIIIDEAHHFRNPGLVARSRYWKLYDIAEDKAVFMLTAKGPSRPTTGIETRSTALKRCRIAEWPKSV
jgi:hypothetical protein